MLVVIGSDHAGYTLKRWCSSAISRLPVTRSKTSGPTPSNRWTIPICARVARAVVRGGPDVGIVIGGSGQGEAMAANKVHGAQGRAPPRRVHRGARPASTTMPNVLSVGARVVATELALDILDVFMATGFEGGRHVARIDELSAIESEECGPGDPTPQVPTGP